MSPSAVALTTIFGLVALGAAVGFLAGVHRKMDLEQWAVGGRGFGALLIYVLMAGEVYTTFSFLGASGWAYSRGGPTLYVLANLTLAYVVSFFILPQLWEVGRKYALQTLPDFFSVRYGSKYLAGFVSLVGVIFLLPYFQLQVTGLGIIVSLASFGAIGRTPAIAISVTLLAAFVLAAGIRAVAWVSILKDGLMLFAALAIGIGIPYLHFGGIGPMFTALLHAKPSHLTMPGSTANLGHSWYISTVLLTALGAYMWPHTFAASFSAKSADTLRRNAVWMPVYTITLALILVAGFSAVLVVPRLSDGDLALLTAVRQSFPPWLMGLIGGAGALTAMVPAAILVLTASTLFAKNVCRSLLAPSMTDSEVTRLARLMVVVLSGVSLYLAIYSSITLVSLILTGFAGVTQFFPGVVLGLYWKRASSSAIFAGLVAGVATVSFLILTNRDPFLGWNAGFLGLCLNLLIAIGVSCLVPLAESFRVSSNTRSGLPSAPQ
jgi:solute:Na+ symporter, SSS family